MHDSNFRSYAFSAFPLILPFLSTLGGTCLPSRFRWLCGFPVHFSLFLLTPAAVYRFLISLAVIGVVANTLIILFALHPFYDWISFVQTCNLFLFLFFFGGVFCFVFLFKHAHICLCPLVNTAMIQPPHWIIQLDIGPINDLIFSTRGSCMCLQRATSGHYKGQDADLPKYVQGLHRLYHHNL